jgi:hypothetical protein
MISLWTSPLIVFIRFALTSFCLISILKELTWGLLNLPSTAQYLCISYYILWVCVCSLRYPAYNTHASYYRLWYVRLYNIFLLYLINGDDFRKKVLNILVKCVFWFSLRLVSKRFPTLRRSERVMTNKAYWYSCKVPFILVRFKWNLILLDTFTKNLQKLNFMKIRSEGTELLHADRWLAWEEDRYNEYNSGFS